MIKPSYNVTEKAITELLILLDNFFAGLSEKMQAEEILVYKQAMHDIAVSQISLDEKIYTISREIYNDERIPQDEKEKAIQMITEFAEKFEVIPARKGIKDLERIMRNSGLSPEAKQRMAKILDTAKHSLNDPSSIIVNRAQYDAMRRLINQAGIQYNIVAMPLASGNYLFTFNRDMKDKMVDIAKAAGYSLGTLKRPTPEDIKAQAYAEAKDKSAVSILVFSNIPPEMAERAVVESGHVGMVTFAKEKQENGNYTLTCLAGNNPEERDICLTRAKNILAYSAYMTTGMSGIVGKAQARHTARENEAIEKVLDAISDPEIQEEDEGFVFSLHTIQKNDQRFTLADTYVEFDRNSFTDHNRGAIGNPVYAADDPAQYRYNLETNIKSGSGQKIYISRKQMDEIESLAGDIYQEIAQGSLPSNSLDALGKLSEDIAELKNAKDNAENSVIKAGIQNDIRKAQIKFDAIAFTHQAPSDISYEAIKDRVIAAELDNHVFRFRTKYAAEKEGLTEDELNKIIDTESRMAQYCYKNNEEISPNVLDANFSRESAVYGRDDANGINMFKPDEYIVHEAKDPAINENDIANGKKTVEQIREDDNILSKYTEAHIQEAGEVLSNISVHMEKVDVIGIETPFAQHAKAKIDELTKNITGKPDKEESVFEELEHDHTASRDTKEQIEL